MNSSRLQTEGRTISEKEFETLPSNIDRKTDWRTVEAKHQSPFSWQIGTFKVPYNMTEKYLPGVFRIAYGKWVAMMKLQGFSIQGKPVIKGPYHYVDIATGLTDASHKEFRIAAVFAARENRVRIEVG